MGFHDYNSKNEVSESTKLLDRIDRLLNQLNGFWIAPLDIAISNRYNYEVIISLLETLYLEISSQLEPNEEAQNKTQREKIKTLLKDHPVFLYRTDSSMGGRTQKTIKNYDNWNLLKEELFNYDRMIRKWINIHLKKQIYIDEGDIVDGDEPIPMSDIEDDDD